MTYKTILSSETYNPLTIAEEMLQDDNFNICYVNVKNNAPYLPCSYVVYEIMHRGDTVVVSTINYADGIIYTNTKQRAGNWKGWKKTTMTNV